MSRLHYGSLEESINITHSRNDLELSYEQQEIFQDFERARNARALAVPTDDAKVRQRLRDLGEPRILFGEEASERRDRLRNILSKKSEEEIEMLMESSSEEEEDEETEEFYTLGSQQLVDARKYMVGWSLARAKTRILNQRNELSVSVPNRKRVRHCWYQNMKTFATLSSQFGDDRPLTYCEFSPNSRLLATGSWSGLIKLWNIPGCDCAHVLKGHKDRVSGIAFHPSSTRTQSSNSLNLASGSVDGSVNLWSLTSNTPIGQLEGHEMRVCRVAFHPSGRYLGTSSFDMTWRLWDAETRQELLLQEGHSKEVFALGFQCDGSLVASGGMDSIGRVWDTRTGRSVMVLQGHVKSILSLDWSPNGYQLATGSEDNRIMIWDIRSPGKFGASYTIPAHTNIVTQVKYFNPLACFDAESKSIARSEFDFTTWVKENQDLMDQDVTADNFVLDVEDSKSINRHVIAGSYLASSSYDGTCKIWTEGDWKPVKTLTGLEGKIMCCDVSSGKFLLSN